MLRALRESDHFAQQRNELVDAQVWDRVWIGLDATTAADPESGTPIGDTGVWVVIVGPAPGWGVARMRVYYTFNDEYVDLVWIEASA